jgi:Cu+-exporting ATPase
VTGAGGRAIVVKAPRLAPSTQLEARTGRATIAFLFNGLGISVATTGLVYPVWAMVAMAVSVTSIFR